MKRFISFALAVVLSFSLLIGSAFASSGAFAIGAPDTFISWGDSNNPYTLAVPSEAVTNRNFIVYQERNWIGTYLQVRFVIDSFDPDVVPVEGESVSGWIRYTGSWEFGVNSALTPSRYKTSLFSDDVYRYSKSVLHKTVYSNFDYYDSDGNLVIGALYKDLTLNDGTVIQVPASIFGAPFVVAKSNTAEEYKIWLFDSTGGVYEGATELSYSTSVGSLVGGATVVVGGLEVDLSSSGIDFAAYPYVYVLNSPKLSYVMVNACKVVPYVIFNSKYNYYNLFGTQYCASNFVESTGEWSEVSFKDTSSFTSQISSFSDDDYAINFDLYLENSTDLYRSSSFSLGGGGWSWCDFESQFGALSVLSYGEIVYQTFDYPLAVPDDETIETPAEDIPDGSNNGLFAWLKQQFVFLLEKLSQILVKLDTIIVAIGGDSETEPDDGSGDDSGDGSGTEQDMTFWQRLKKVFEDALASIIEGLLDLITKVLDVVLGLLYDLLEFFFGLLSDAVVNGFGSFFEALADESLLKLFQVEQPLLDENGAPVLDDNGNPVTETVFGLPVGVVAVFTFISSAIMVLPDPVRYALLFGIGSMFLFAVLKLMKL